MTTPAPHLIKGEPRPANPWAKSAPLVCAACSAPVERAGDNDWQHTTVDAGLSCTAWPVRPARAEVETGR